MGGGYTWTSQKLLGDNGEKKLDSYFSRWYSIQPVTLTAQKSGIDRLFTRPNGERISVEYKSDFRATETRRAYIEITHTAVRSGLGWAVTSTADKIIYYLPKSHTAYILNTSALRSALPTWQRQYKVFKSRDDIGVSRGIGVPLAELARVGITVSIE